MKDFFNNMKVVRAISPVDAADDTALVGEVVDRVGFESVTYLIAAGTLADTGATFTSLLEESDTGAFGGEENAVVDADLLGTEALASFTEADDDKVFKLGYIGNKQHTRLTITPAGVSATANIVAAICVLTHAHDRPVA